MILFIVVSFLIIIQIIFRVVYNKKIKTISKELNDEFAKFEVIPNYKKKNNLATLVSFCAAAIIYTFPASLNVIFYMHFPKEMLFGQLNMLFSVFLIFNLFAVINLIHHKILQCYIIEHIQANKDIDTLTLPKIDLKKSLILDFTNIVTSLMIVVMIIALYIIL